jgi:hypothetical protein
MSLLHLQVVDKGSKDPYSQQMISKELHSAQAITVRQIAERLAKPGEQLSTVIDRIRHWTDEDMLSVQGEKNPGTGRARLYEPRALMEAFVLGILSDAVGHPVSAPKFTLLFRSERKSIAWPPLRNGKQNFLVVGYSRAGGAEVGTTSAQGLAHHISTSSHDALVVIDLVKLESRINSNGARHGKGS